MTRLSFTHYPRGNSYERLLCKMLTLAFSLVCPAANKLHFSLRASSKEAFTFGFSRQTELVACLVLVTGGLSLYPDEGGERCL